MSSKVLTKIKDVSMQVHVHVHIRPFSVVSSKHSPGPPVLSLECIHPGPSLPHLAPDASCEVSAGVSSSSTPHSAVCTKTLDLFGCFLILFFHIKLSSLQPTSAAHPTSREKAKSKLWSIFSFFPFSDRLTLLHLNFTLWQLSK